MNWCDVAEAEELSTEGEAMTILGLNVNTDVWFV